MIKNFDILLKEINNKNNDDNLLHEELIKINSVKNLNKYINNSNLVYKIQIDGKKTKEYLKHLNLFEIKTSKN